MIYISAHKDFDLKLKQETINKLKDDLCIIDGGELKNNYPISIIHETELNNDIYNLHNDYGELTRMYYIYKNIDKYNDDIIGFIQYRKYFPDDVLINHRQLLKEYDLICSENTEQHVMCNQFKQYLLSEMELCFRLVAFFKPEYNNDLCYLYNNTKMICHNMFIMRKEDFIKCCDFIFSSLNILYKTLHIEGEYKFSREKELSIVAERLFHLFFIHHFNASKIIYSKVNIY